MREFKKNKTEQRTTGRYSSDRTFVPSERRGTAQFNSRDTERTETRSNDRFDRRDAVKSPAKILYRITCARCGEQSEVPFHPVQGKPVYCYDCFKKTDSYGSKQVGISKTEFDQLNEKLDKIMDALHIR